MNIYNQRFNNKVALITGASSGIGAAIAARLAAEGASVMLFARREHCLKELVEKFKGNGWKASYFSGDVTNENNVKECVQLCLDQNNAIDVLVNNAGIELVRPLAMTACDEWKQLLDINLGGAIRFMQCVQRFMAQSLRGGTIINVSSISGLVGVPGLSIYSMTKGGLISLTRSMALEIASRNIRVNVIAAGMVETDLTKRLFAKLSNQQVEHIKQMHPLGLGTPDDIAAGVAYLASDEARWITGTVLVIDGGYTAS